jgi:hypothetical protein
MKRRTTKEREKLFTNYLKYKWELCRRNKEYIKDYGRLELEEIEADEMRRKWGFFDDPMDDSWPDFPVYFKKFDGNDSDSAQQEGSTFCKDLLTLTVIKDPKNRKTKKIIIELSPEAPLNIVLSGIEHLFHQKTIANFPDKRPQWEQLEVDLTIYDYFQKGISYENIANLCYPRDDLDTAVSKISKGLARIRDKIKTGKIW